MWPVRSTRSASSRPADPLERLLAAVPAADLERRDSQPVAVLLGQVDDEALLDHRGEEVVRRGARQPARSGDPVQRHRVGLAGQEPQDTQGPRRRRHLTHAGIVPRVPWDDPGSGQSVVRVRVPSAGVSVVVSVSVAVAVVGSGSLLGGSSPWSSRVHRSRRSRRSARSPPTWCRPPGRAGRPRAACPRSPPARPGGPARPVRLVPRCARPRSWRARPWPERPRPAAATR